MNIPYAIINTDLDGFLSGLLLHNFLGTEIVGFSDSGTTIWKREGVAWEDCTCIDMYVVPPQIKTLCNHMGAVDDDHAKELFWNSNKKNPNLEIATRSFLDSYTTKFSLATVHYLIALLECEGHSLHKELNLRNTSLGYRCIDVLLRADDVMNNSVHTYRDNCLFWWDKMYEIASTRGQGQITKSFMNYTNAIHGGNIRVDVARFKKHFANFVKNRFGCDSPDGGYKNLGFGDTTIGDNPMRFITWLSELTGLRCFPLHESLVRYEGEAHRTNVSIDELQEIKQGTYRGQKLFSYAFVCRPSSENHFSYTVNLERK